jgi:hypothetical protein
LPRDILAARFYIVRFSLLISAVSLLLQIAFPVIWHWEKASKRPAYVDGLSETDKAELA